MASSGGRLGFALGLGVRAVFIGALSFLAIWLAYERSLYASALLALGVAALLVADVVRQLRTADRLLARFIDGLMVEGDERPAAATGLPAVDTAMRRALDRVASGKAERQRRIDYLETLADTVSAALLVVDEAGKVEAANHAARRLLPNVRRLSDLGEEAQTRLEGARAGAGEIVKLPDGRPMFAMASEFATPQGGRRRLISLQRVTGDLDAVELRAWGDLVRVLSHEIMNSLTPICSLAESAQGMVPAGSPAGEALAIIGRRSAGLMTFVERYRQVFDIPEPQRQPIPLGEVLARVERLMGAMLQEGGIGFSCVCEAPRLRVEVDAALMDQAIINLVKNAAEAVRGKPGAKVLLSARLADEAVQIEVADNGPGLLPEDVDAAFIPFFTRKDEGSGVGLSVSRQIAIAHGGAVEYAPAMGGGAVFRIRLPV